MRSSWRRSRGRSRRSEHSPFFAPARRTAPPALLDPRTLPAALPQVFRALRASWRPPGGTRFLRLRFSPLAGYACVTLVADTPSCQPNRGPPKQEETKPMSDERKAPKIENLELNRETIQDLTEDQGERAKGGATPMSTRPCSKPYACPF